VNELIGRVFDFESDVFPIRSDLYAKLAGGQSPKALMISCADSRVVPEEIMQAQPGDLFVCRNAGNIVPPYSENIGGVSATVEYAVLALGVRDIIVCGHSDCGAMKALMNPAPLAGMPSVKAWLEHSRAAHSVVCNSYPDMTDAKAVRAASLENVVVQIQHLRSHPSVAAAIARGEVALHGWFFDIEAGQVLALDGDTHRFVAINKEKPLPVAVHHAERRAADFDHAEAAE
jgi:carbonic anhydrase